MNWFEVKVKYSMIGENGAEQKMSEPYLVDALSFTEAEARINKEMEPYLSDEFQIVNMKRANYTDLLEDEEGDKYFKCKIVFVTIDEEKGKEKKTSNYILVQAKDIESALTNLKAGFRDMTIDWDVTTISETMIMDVFKYFDDAVEEIPEHLKPIDKTEEEDTSFEEDQDEEEELKEDGEDQSV